MHIHIRTSYLFMNLTSSLADPSSKKSAKNTYIHLTSGYKDNIFSTTFKIVDKAQHKMRALIKKHCKQNLGNTAPGKAKIV